MPRDAKPSEPFRWWIAAALFALTVPTYWPSIHNGFIWDDPAYVVNNPTLRSLGGLWSIWTDPWATPQYYPMVHTTFWIESQLWGTKNAMGFHVDNILLHALAAVLLWRALKRIGLPWPILAAAIFAVHPVMVESVAWVTERKNVLSIVFYLLAFHAYWRFLPPSPGTPGEGWGEGDFEGKAASEIRNRPHPNPLPEYRERGPEKAADKTRKRWYLLSLGLFLLALLSKTVTCSLPAAIALILYWKRGRLTKADFRPLLPMFVIGAVMAWFTGHLEATHVGARGPDFDWTPIDRCLIAGHAVCFYAGKIVWPHPLLFMYPRWDLHADRSTQFIFPVTVALFVITLWLLGNRLGRGPLVAVLFFIGTLVPALGFVNVYPMRYSFVADHFQYLASIGLIALITAILSQAKRFVPLPIMLPIVLAPLIYLTVTQQKIYKNEQTLWENEISRYEPCWMAHINLAGVYDRAKRLDDAMTQTKRALELAPNEADTRYDMGVAMAERKRWPQARDWFAKATEADPQCAPALSYLSLVLWDDLATDPDRVEAVRDAQKALALDPNLPAAHLVLGKYAAMRNDLHAALTEFQTALTIDPDNIPAHAESGGCLVQLGQYPQAVGEYLKVIEHNPNDLAALTNLGKACALAGRKTDAMQWYQKALAVDPNWEPAKAGLRDLQK
jgi:tetratricopeptide (TPR) repeat protein